MITLLALAWQAALVVVVAYLAYELKVYFNRPQSIHKVKPALEQIKSSQETDPAVILDNEDHSRNDSQEALPLNRDLSSHSEGKRVGFFDGRKSVDFSSQTNIGLDVKVQRPRLDPPVHSRSETDKGLLPEGETIAGTSPLLSRRHNAPPIQGLITQPLQADFFFSLSSEKKTPIDKVPCDSAVCPSAGLATESRLGHTSLTLVAEALIANEEEYDNPYSSLPPSSKTAFV
jgi:hypothetical protein